MDCNYSIGQRTAVDGKTWWTCFYKNCKGDRASVGRFKTKKAAIYFKENILDKK